MDETFNLYFALKTAIGSVLMLAFGWIFWTKGTRTTSSLSSCGLIAGCVILAFAETDTLSLLCVGCILIVTCGLALLHTSFQKMSIGTVFGTAWTNKIYFDPEADNDIIIDVTGRKLMTKMLDLVGEDEDIKTVSLYKCPLRSWQWTMYFFFHNFVIFKTKKWCWSIEKNTEAIIIRRRKEETDVKDKRNKKNKRLCKVVQTRSARGKTSVHDLIKWLCDEHELYNQYHGPSTNCQYFANAVFDKVAMSAKSWCYVIKFRPEADKDFICFKDSELMTKRGSIVEEDETIQNVFLYEDPTHYDSIWRCIFQTNVWWWSIENMQEIMIITRNRKKMHVEQYLKAKGPYKERKSARSTKTVHDLINWLYNKKELKKSHIYVMLSTETFANDVFNYVSENER